MSLVLLAVLAALVIGAAGCTSLHVALRGGVFRRQANARFVLWFGLLLAVTCSAPVVLVSGSLWLQRVPTVAVSSLPPVSTAATATFVPKPPAAHALVTPAHAIAVVWFAGFLLALLRLAAGIMRVRYIRERAETIELRTIARGPVRILACDHFDVPVALGYRHPAVVVPRAMLALERETDFENVVLHELEHLRRFDDLTSLVQAACMCVLWFNPFAHAIAARLGIEREMACDEAVVTRTGRRASYASTLWKVAIGSSDAIAPALTSGFGAGPHTAPRLTNLLVTRAGSAVSTRKPLVLAAVLTLAFIVSAAFAPMLVLGSPTIEAFTRVHLSNGTTLVIGGRRADGALYKDLQVYDASGRRTAIVPMPIPRWSATATLRSDGTILIRGGENATGALRCRLLYDPRKRRLTQT